MLALHLSKNLGVSYRTIERFENLLVANEYIERHKNTLESGRWFMDDQDGRIVLVCHMFEVIAHELMSGAIKNLSDDPQLKRYLMQQRLIKVSGIF